MSKLKLLLIILIGLWLADGHDIIRRQASTPPPNEDDATDIDDQDSFSNVEDDDAEDSDEDCNLIPERAKVAARYFPETLSRQQTLNMLKRAVELMEKPSSSRNPKRPCRQDAELEIQAKNTLRFLTGDPSIGSTNSSQACSSHVVDEDYCPEIFTISNDRKISDDTIKRIIDLHHNEHLSEKAIKAQYPWYRRQYLPRMQQYITIRNRRNIYDQINEHVLHRIDDAFVRLLPIHDYHLQQWGFDKADEINMTDFKASKGWLSKVKKMGNVVGRKVTKYKSRAELDRSEEIEASKERFKDNYSMLAEFFPHRRILNVDQSGHRYEISNLRSLGRRGSRNHELRIDSENKNSHSYTIQPIIGRDG